MKLRIKKPEDRETVATILFRNGYTVKPGKYKPPGEKAYVSYVEIVENNGTQEERT